MDTPALAALVACHGLTLTAGGGPYERFRHACLAGSTFGAAEVRGEIRPTTRAGEMMIERRSQRRIGDKAGNQEHNHETDRFVHNRY